MLKTYSLEKIKNSIDHNALIPAIEDGFVKYSQQKTVIPPVGHLRFENPPGDLHIKYGYIKNDEYYVIKIASGFYDNPKLGLPSGQGMMLVFSQKTGEPKAILLDDGYLTDLRTAVAGAICAKYIAPKKVSTVGIVGTGVQARLQLELLAQVRKFTKVIAWGRNQAHLKKYQKDMQAKGFAVETTSKLEYLAGQSNLIVTTTPSEKPLLEAEMIKSGTHITAVGADTIGKQELDEKILQKADLVVADSLSQCLDHGEIHHAVKSGLIDPKNIVELGEIIKDASLSRQDAKQITVADLTGVAVQDIQIAKMVYQTLESAETS